MNIKASMELNLDNENLNDVVDQFRCPKGEQGISLGELLYRNNREIIRESIKALDLEDKNRVLELGHGNCNHLPFLMEQAENVKYFGMEISEVMLKEASRVNEKYIKKKDALFQAYDGVRVPYVHNIFDRILTVNTIYFWKEPINYLNEMFRVLRPGGLFVLTFTNSKFIEQLSSVVNDGNFLLYTEKKIKKMLKKTDFILNSIEEKTRQEKNIDGNLIDNNYTIVKLRKKAKNRYER